MIFNKTTAATAIMIGVWYCSKKVSGFPASIRPSGIVLTMGVIAEEAIYSMTVIFKCRANIHATAAAAVAPITALIASSWRTASCIFSMRFLKFS